jgi:hypothetical protein
MPAFGKNHLRGECFVSPDKKIDLYPRGDDARRHVRTADGGSGSTSKSGFFSSK